MVENSTENVKALKEIPSVERDEFYYHQLLTGTKTSRRERIESPVQKYDQYFYGHGKILLTGEYFILDGATGLALSTKVGQSMGIRYEQNYQTKGLTWRSFDCEGNIWFEATFEFWNFNLTSASMTEEALFLQKILRQARKQNKHFLRDEKDVVVETQLGFPLSWGLGSSSTLIYNIAQWAYVSPFELLFHTLGGSGYDVACAQSEGPILYERKRSGPKWVPTHFFPEFHQRLYFVYRGQKMNSREAIHYYREKKPLTKNLLKEVSLLTKEVLGVQSLRAFRDLVETHEDLLAHYLDLPPVRSLYPDFKGTLKSLGAWGGDFILAVSEGTHREVWEYFHSKGLSVVIPFEELILPLPKIYPTHLSSTTGSRQLH